MKTSLSILLLLSVSFLATANVAQPGMWQAGGMGNFSLLYPEDSLAYQKIQMAKEQISIQLYPGFAVVHGTYWMQNDTDTSYTIKTGYPINSMLESEGSRKLMLLNFDELYGLKVLINGQEIQVRRDSLSNLPPAYENNWYLWENQFPKQSTTKIEIFFLMDTNQAIVRDGYQKSMQNGFIYLLETGAIWKQPITEGTFRLKMMEDLRLEDISGIIPNEFFKQNNNEQILLGSFADLSPSFKDNIVIRYGERLKDFDFNKVMTKKADYFEKAKTFSQKDLSTLSFEAADFGDPFEVFLIEQGRGLKNANNLYMLSILGVFVLIVVFYIRRRQQKKQ